MVVVNGQEKRNQVLAIEQEEDTDAGDDKGRTVDDTDVNGGASSSATSVEDTTIDDEPMSVDGVVQVSTVHLQ